ncbi:MAG: phenylalanine--tRNA ligase subunit alpha [Acidobacteria bacterium]|nr:phenylalanine--tRNA ligase subunit alpha [Acidobacteriota bacterium]
MSDPAAINRLRAQFLAELAATSGEPALRGLRDRYLGRKSGAITALLKSVAAAPPDVRPTLGRLANELKGQIETALAERLATVEAPRHPADAVDVTLPGRDFPLGHRHPLTLLRERIEEIFTRMGYQGLEGPECEDDYHNYEALNMPPHHPARDMQDTLYLASPFNERYAVPGTGRRDAYAANLLRTHTSGMQIRYMETHAPPVRIIVPGRVYRRDNLDLTHTPMFTQIEGLVVDEGVTLADLKGTMAAFLGELFETDAKVRFRPSFFPYTEPSAEVLLGCIFCKGSGCGICKKTGWLEVAGSGMVHPALFERVGYDPERYTGFAFGMGVERIAIVKYGVDDIRMFYENDLRFLEQFGQ